MRFKMRSFAVVLALGFVVSVALTGSVRAAVLVDINADGTDRDGATADFDAATGLAGGMFGGDSVTVFPNDSADDPHPIDRTVGNIRLQITDSTTTATGDADGWFGGGTDNDLLEDGFYMRHTSADPTGLITLSGSGLGLSANQWYELYLFAGRSQGHETTFTFDVNDPSDPSGGTAVHTDPPAVGGDNTLGTAKFTFKTGATPPASLVIKWDGAQHVNGNQDACFSGFVLREIPAPTVAYWQLDEASGNLVDVVTHDGATQTLTGQSGLTYSETGVAPDPVPNPDSGPFTSGTTNDNPNSIGFSGATLAPKITDATPFKITTTSSFTFEGWLLHNVTDGSHAAYEYVAGDRHRTTTPSGYLGWHVVVSSGKIQMYSGGLSATTTTRVDDGNPHHFAAVWDHVSGAMRVYLDGSLEDTTALTPASYTQDAFSVGGRCTGTDSIYNDSSLNGRLDELRFSNVVLAPSEFLSHNNTIAYWQFDSNDGSPGLTDSVGSYDLAVVAGTFVADASGAVDPVPNPDATAIFSGDSSDNPDAGVANASLLAPGGTSQHYLNVPTDPGNVFNLAGKSFTFEGWFQHETTSDPSGFGDIIGGTRNDTPFKGYLLMMMPGGVIRAYFTDGTTAWEVKTSGTDYRSATEFHHFAFIWEDGAGDNSAGLAEIYIDGVLEASGSAPAAFSAAAADSGEPFIIAGRGAGSDNTWDGRFDEFRFSRAALAPLEFLSAKAPEIAILYPANGATGIPPSAYLVATFDEGIETNTTGSIVISNRTDHSITTIAIGDTNQVTVSGTTLTINPSSDLDNNTLYAVLIDTDALKDSDGTFFAGITNATTWAFETGVPAELLHNWPFDANLTDVIGGKDATAFGDAGVQTASSKIGTGAALFDGTGDYMTAGTASDFVVGTGVKSVSFWFKGAYEASDRMLATGATSDSQAGWAVFQTATAFDPAMGDGTSSRIIGATPASNPYDGQWHLAVMVFDATTDTVIGYLDGVAGTPVTGTAGSIANTYPLYFGTRAGAGSLYMNGQLDDVAIWEGTLSQADVNRLWSDGDGFPAEPPTQGTIFMIR